MPWTLDKDKDRLRWKGRRKSVTSSQIAASRFETKWNTQGEASVRGHDSMPVLRRLHSTEVLLLPELQPGTPPTKGPPMRQALIWTGLAIFGIGLIAWFFYVRAHSLDRIF